MLISSFHLTNGTLITAFFFFYLKLGLVCKKYNRFIQYILKNCLNTFVQSAEIARRQADEKSSAAAETMKLLPERSYGYQILDHSRHIVRKFLNAQCIKKHSALNSKLFKRFNYITDQLYEVELVKPEIEHREPIIVGSLILQRMLELYYKLQKFS